MPLWPLGEAPDVAREAAPVADDDGELWELVSEVGAGAAEVEVKVMVVGARATLFDDGVVTMTEVLGTVLEL